MAVRRFHHRRFASAFWPASFEILGKAYEPLLLGAVVMLVEWLIL
ncbi:MAG TPA: hypothetical protein VHG89_10750 [Verrucomicrobiae bacterium]|nr:hypothetical protein [Verrucomicrobiae bacterium]